MHSMDCPTYLPIQSDGRQWPNNSILRAQTMSRLTKALEPRNFLIRFAIPKI